MMKLLPIIKIFNRQRLLKMWLLLGLWLFSAAAALESVHQSAPQRSPVGLFPSDPDYSLVPFVDGGKLFINGRVSSYSGHVINVTSPILDLSTGQPIVIGRMSQMVESDLNPVIDSANRAWDYGQGVWPQMTMSQRVAALQNAVEAIKLRRDEIITILMWEICKTQKDAASEFDRTLSFIEASIQAFIDMDAQNNVWKSIEGILARIRRTAIGKKKLDGLLQTHCFIASVYYVDVGIVLCVGPFNYPLNETYATLIPALLMGNVVIMKVPSIGGLAHMLTMQAYSDHLPAGTLQFVTGSGRTLLGPIVRSGSIDALAFIGGRKAADLLLKEHPHLHRLKVFAQLEAKNMG
jgi:glyceraldehyde-3-phosphate dehydrogenase (NADP+)